MRITRAATLGVAALILAVASAVATTAQSPLLPSGPAGNGVIAFSSGGDIWVVDPDGTDRRQLTTAPGLEHSPAWSADGTRLAYWSQDALGTPPSVVVMNGDGSGTMTIATHEAVGHGPVIEPRLDMWPDPYRLDWSPDGARLAYSFGSGGDERVWVASTDGSGSALVGDPDLTAWHPDWSPDGTLLAFAGSRAGAETGVYVMAPDGTGVHRLSRVQDDGQYAFFKAEWSPDGTGIVTQASSPDGDGWGIWIIAADGSGDLDIGRGIIPKWSPDSEWVAFYGDGGMIVVARDGGDARVVEIGDDKEVVWSPDGTAFAVLGSTGMEVIDAVTGEVRADIAVPDQIRNHLNYPSWQRVAR
jgi:Tol biopolymer transport system component